MAKYLRFLIFTVMLCGLLCFPVLTVAESSQTIAQGFQTKGNADEFVTGALVSGQVGDAQTVELATNESADRLIGVVDKSSLVVVSSNSKEVQVVISGTTHVLVSDINGEVHEGDSITASPIAGVGMIATVDSRVVGTAQTNFDSTTSKTETIKDVHGQDRTIHIGYVQLHIGVAYYQAPGSNFLPPFIQDVANSVAGRQVALFRVIIGSVIALFGLVSVGIFMYSSVRASIVSMGRNPLAAHNIRKSLYQVGGVGVLILAGSLFVSYLIIAL